MFSRYWIIKALSKKIESFHNKEELLVWLWGKDTTFFFLVDLGKWTDWKDVNPKTYKVKANLDEFMKEIGD